MPLIVELLDGQQHPAIILAVISLITCTIYSAVWRLYFSPIAHFPGPKLAALTLWYELYYDVILNGQYTFKIIELHRQYGPIIRISPWELHCSDFSFHDEIYASSATGRKRNKYEWFTKSFGFDHSVFSIVDHDKHKIRRNALNPFFSKLNISRLQPLVQERVGVMLERIGEFKDSRDVLNTSRMYFAYAQDVVMQYATGRSNYLLEAPDFDPTYRDATLYGVTAATALKHASWLNLLLQSLPDWLVRLSHPTMALYIEQKKNMLKQISRMKASISSEDKEKSHATIFHELLKSKRLSEEHKSEKSLNDEALVLLNAGTMSVAWVFEVSTFHLIRHPAVLRRLKAELQENIPDPSAAIPLAQLEQLVYLNAVVKETLRLTYGAAGRLARIAPEEELRYVDKDTGKEWIVPRGVPIGMSNAQLHHNEEIFPSSREYSPERWLTPDGRFLNPKLDKYLLSFSRGSRQCIGMPLSYSEIFLGLSKIWNVYGSKGGVTETGERYEGVRFEDDIGVFELYETGKRDVELYAGAFLSLVHPDSKGIRVKVLS